MSWNIKLYDDVYVEVDENFLKKVESVQKQIPKDDVYLYLVLILIAFDKTIDDIYDKDKTFLMKLLQEESPVGPVSTLASQILDNVFQDVYSDDP